MSRDIKFRAWGKEKQYMFQIFDNSGEDWYLPKWKVKHEVTQYTGLKDKNEKEIYENDIVKFGEMDRIVLFEQGSYVLRVIKMMFTDSTPLQYCNLEKIEVIGNIYENPELLS